MLGCPMSMRDADKGWGVERLRRLPFKQEEPKEGERSGNISRGGICGAGPTAYLVDSAGRAQSPEHTLGINGTD